jgi:hypothetical protein
VIRIGFPRQRLDNRQENRHISRMAGTSSSRIRTKHYRDSLRRRGLRPVRIWVPDLRAPDFKAAVERQCRLINAADKAENLMGWVENVSVLDDDAR